MTEARQHSGELQQRLRALHQREVGQTDLLDKLELDELRHVVGLAHSEHAGDDVLRAVAELPEVVQQLEGLVYIGLDAVVQHVLDQDRMRLIANLNTCLNIYNGMFPCVYLENILPFIKESLVHRFNSTGGVCIQL